MSAFSSFRMLMAAGAVGVGPPPVVTQLGTYESSVNGRTYTYSSAPFGTAVAGRGIIVIVQGGGGDRDWVSCTIGGVSATEIVQTVSAPGANTNSVAMYYAEPSGTSGNVVVNSDPGASQMARAQINVMSITGHNATPTATAEDETASNTTAATVNINLPENGVCILGASCNSNTTYTWTNATEYSDFQVSGETGTLSTAVRTASSAETGTTITGTATSSNLQSIVAASFAPA